MCNQLTKLGTKCCIQPNKSYCHIHNKMIAKYNLKKEVINLNKTIQKKTIQINELNNNLEFFKNEVNNIQKKYEEDYNKYQIIKQYEILKNKLININPQSSPYKILCDNKYKQTIKKTFNKDINVLKDEFNYLRKKRIEYCHSIKSM